MNEQEYAFGAKFNYDMYNFHQDGWKAGDLQATETEVVHVATAMFVTHIRDSLN